MENYVNPISNQINNNETTSTVKQLCSLSQEYWFSDLNKIHLIGLDK